MPFRVAIITLVVGRLAAAAGALTIYGFRPRGFDCRLCRQLARAHSRSADAERRALVAGLVYDVVITPMKGYAGLDWVVASEELASAARSSSVSKGSAGRRKAGSRGSRAADPRPDPARARFLSAEDADAR